MGKTAELTINNQEPNLSFFIPTYSRQEPLKLTIQSIKDNWPQECISNIIISDNNENSIAEEVVRKFDQSRLIYSKNKNNIGIDRNMLRYLDLCDSQYCWLLGDDDTLNSISYNMIQPYLSQEFDFLIILDGLIKTRYKTGIYQLDTNDKVGDFLTHFWDKIPFGNIIVNAKKAKEVSSVIDLNKYIGSSHAYSGLLWEMLCSDISSKNVVIIEERAVELGVIEKTWTEDSTKIFLHEIPSWIDLLPEKLGTYKISILNRYLGSISHRTYLILYAKFINKSRENRHLYNNYVSSFPFKFKIRIKVFRLLFPLYNFLLKHKKNSN